MTPLESFTRLAAVGVSVEGLTFIGDQPMLRVHAGTRFFFISPTSATALLCNAVLEKWPHWMAYETDDGWWFVQVVSHRHPSLTATVAQPGKSRLAALTRAAEAKHKETPND